MSLQLLVILVPVLFAFMGFALDLGRLYLVRTELNQAANALALAAAGQLLGTTASIDNATTAVTQATDTTTGGVANTFNFGSLVAGNATGALSSTVAPAFFSTVADATAANGNPSDGQSARFVQITLRAEAPLLFWSMLPGGESRKTLVATQAVAGISAPVCTACGAEPFAVAALDATDTVNFGFGDPTAGQLYTFAFECVGTGRIAALPGTTAVIQYALLNRADANSALDEQQQLFRDGAGGLIASSTPNPTGSSVPLACMAVGDAVENIWPATSPNTCGSAAPIGAVKAMCGLSTRAPFGQPLSGACTLTGTDVTDLSTAFLPDTDQRADQTLLYADYTGNGRRIITIPIVDTLAINVVSTMTILGFRQFLLMPAQDGTPLDPGDTAGRFVVQYIGSPAPVAQGYFDDRFQLNGGSCPANGPGKVVLHQ